VRIGHLLGGGHPGLSRVVKVQGLDLIFESGKIDLSLLSAMPNSSTLPSGFAVYRKA
jgi:hypothetical protein